MTSPTPPQLPEVEVLPCDREAADNWAREWRDCRGQHTALVQAFARHRTEALAKSNEEREALADPGVVHLNMLRGGIAKPSPANIWHLYGDQALIEAMPSSASAQLRQQSTSDGGEGPAAMIQATQEDSHGG